MVYLTVLLPVLHIRASVEHQALGSGRLQGKLAYWSFIVLRKLAGKTGQLPDNYLVNKGAGFQVEETNFTCGGFVDVRMGILVDKAVAVKTIHVAQDSNFSKTRKVSTLTSVRFRFIQDIQNSIYRTFVGCLYFG